MVVQKDVCEPQGVSPSPITAKERSEISETPKPKQIATKAHEQRYKKLAENFLLIAAGLFISDVISSFFFPNHRALMIAAMRGFMTTFTLFGIVPLYFLSRRGA